VVCAWQAGKYYTAGFLGAVPGPQGQVVYNVPPMVVNEDVRRLPNPNRADGLWYRWRYAPLPEWQY
jgi:hypothetical protein